MNMISTLADILADGARTLEDGPYQARLNACATCPSSSRKLGQVVCDRCGCVMALKARFIATSCPEGRWEANKQAPSVNFADSSPTLSGPVGKRV